MPDVDELPEVWSDIVVCGTMIELTRSNTLYCGEGKSLRPQEMNEVLERMNDSRGSSASPPRKSALRPPRRSSGGCGFIDLPGNNDADPGCGQIEGIKEAGAVFVVLKRDDGDNITMKLLKESGLLQRALCCVTSPPASSSSSFGAQPQLHLKDKIDSEDEAETRRNLKESSRTRLGKMLIDVNKKVKIRGPEEEIDQIVADTPMRTIYPMSHTAFAPLRVRREEQGARGSVQQLQHGLVFRGVGALNRDACVRPPRPPRDEDDTRAPAEAAERPR